MDLKQIFCGSGRERMPDIAFRIMSFHFVLRDLLFSPQKKLERMGIKPGDSVVDYGCGPGSFICKASALVGPEGKVFALDVHELAIRSVENLVRKESLGNVTAVLLKGYTSGLESGIADLVYCLDMFHMVEQPAPFLEEIHRLLKPTGRLILEDGHQSRRTSRKKVEDSGLWAIVEEGRSWMVCCPN